jgi:hypothetical protein
MEAVLKILNEMKAAGVVLDYAIGGAMAAYFYAEAVVTEDLDAFVLLSGESGGILLVTPIYEFLQKRGAEPKREHLVVGGTLLQVIPAYDALTEEAVAQAAEKSVGGTATRVMKVEHLIAIALKTGRSKDKLRVQLLLEQATVDARLLEDIVARNGLEPAWKRFKEASA